MAKRFKIEGSRLVITDTISSEIELDMPKRDAFHSWKRLNNDNITIYDTNQTNETEAYKFELEGVSNALNGENADTPFTAETFRTFVGDFLGKSSGGGSSSLTTLEKGIISEQSTSLIAGGVVSVNGGDPTLFDVDLALGKFIDNHTDPFNPTGQEVSLGASVGISVTNLATHDFTIVYKDSSNNIIQRTSIDIEDRRDFVCLATLSHASRTQIDSVSNVTPNPGINLYSALIDLQDTLGALNKGGNTFSAVGANLQIQKSAGEVLFIGDNQKTNTKNPNVNSNPAQTPVANFFYTWRNGSGGFNVSFVNNVLIPGSYDDGTGGALTPNGGVSNNQFQINRVYLLGTQVVIHYGQDVYSTLDAAIGSRFDELVEINPNLQGALFRGWIITKGNASALNDAAQAAFYEADKFGTGSLGGSVGSSTTTLQGAYLNSAQPQFETTALLGSIDYKGGTGTDTDFNIRILNNADTVTGSWAANGDLVVNNATINGDLIVNGTTTTLNTQTVEVEDNLIVVNNGEVGAGVTAGIAGREVDRGLSTNYQDIFRESDKTFRIGEVGSTQAVATREDAPNNTGVPFWNGTENRLDTAANLLYDSGTNTLSFINGVVSGNLAVDTNVLFVDAATDRVGIGTATPDSELHVSNGSVADVLITNIAGVPAVDIFRNDTSILANQDLGHLAFSGADNTGNVRTVHARVSATSDAGHSAGNNPTRLSFFITPSGSETLTEGMRLTNAGTLGIGTTSPNANAILDVVSTTKGMLIPRMTTVQKNAITATNGMMLYDTDLNKFQGYENGAWVSFI